MVLTVVVVTFKSDVAKKIQSVLLKEFSFPSIPNKLFPVYVFKQHYCGKSQGCVNINMRGCSRVNQQMEFYVLPKWLIWHVWVEMRVVWMCGGGDTSEGLVNATLVVDSNEHWFGVSHNKRPIGFGKKV